MAVEFVQPGKQMNVKLGAAAGYHALVAIGDYMIGITRHSGAQNDVVACDVEGVFKFVKASGSALNQGTPVTVAADSDHDNAPTATATSAGSTSNGVVWETAASAATEVLVKINERIAVPAEQAAGGGTTG